MATTAINPMATQRGNETDVQQFRRDISDVRTAISDLKDRMLPALAILTEQITQLQRATTEIVGEVKHKASSTDLATLKATTDLEIARLRQDLETGEANATGMFDSHDERLRDIERSNSEIKISLQNLIETVGKIDKSLAWIRDKVWYFIGGLAVLMASIEFFTHKHT